MRHLILPLLCMLLTACGSNDSFQVKGTVENLGTQNLRILYYANGAVQSTVTTAVDSQFEFTGNSPQETVVEVFSNARTPIGRFIAKNGDKLEISFRQGDPNFLQAKGNKHSEELAAFLQKNEGMDNLNGAIADYVADNPDHFVSGALVSHYFNFDADPALGNLLIDMLDYDAVPYSLTDGLRLLLSRAVNLPDTIGQFSLIGASDSLVPFTADAKKLTACIFSPTASIPDSIVDIAARLDSIGYSIRYFHMSPDTFRLHKRLLEFPKKTVAYWAPLGLSQPELADFGLQQLPYCVVLDSARAVSRRSPEFSF